MKNFKSCVPESIQTKLYAIAQAIENGFKDEIVSGHKSWGIYSGTIRLDEIEGNYVSGWMPHQDGGFFVNAFCQNDIDSSYHFTEKQTEYNNEQQDHCFKSFLSDNDLDSETEYDDLTEEQKEQLSNYEMQWFEPALLSFEMFVDGFSDAGAMRCHDETEILFRVAINYKDAPYYREKYAEDIKSIGFTLEEFEQTTIEEIIEHLKI